jgi:hypothetical protein
MGGSLGQIDLSAIGAARYAPGPAIAPDQFHEVFH